MASSFLDTRVSRQILLAAKLDTWQGYIGILLFSVDLPLSQCLFPGGGRSHLVQMMLLTYLSSQDEARVIKSLYLLPWAVAWREVLAQRGCVASGGGMLLLLLARLATGKLFVPAMRTRSGACLRENASTNPCLRLRPCPSGLADSPGQDGSWCLFRRETWWTMGCTSYPPFSLPPSDARVKSRVG